MPGGLVQGNPRERGLRCVRGKQVQSRTGCQRGQRVRGVSAAIDLAGGERVAMGVRVPCGLRGAVTMHITS